MVKFLPESVFVTFGMWREAVMGEELLILILFTSLNGTQVTSILPSCLQNISIVN
jgi:hypothetical protein